jgi:Apea-like HEPN
MLTTVSSTVSASQPLTGWPVLSSLNFDALERLLEVIAASVHCPFGVKHVLYRPRGWAESWVGDTPAGGTWTWTYERSANGLGRSEVAPKSIHLTFADTERRLHALLNGRHELQVAARRLLLATCRQDPLDAVVDSCIGIEALVGDPSPNEVTHKLALRSAALLSAVDLADARVIFSTVKRLYGHRSKIVHGKLKPNDSNMIDVAGEQLAADSVANALLGLLLQAVLDNPTLSDQISNDELILSRLSERGEPPTAPDRQR